MDEEGNSLEERWDVCESCGTFIDPETTHLFNCTLCVTAGPRLDPMFKASDNTAVCDECATVCDMCEVVCAIDHIRTSDDHGAMCNRCVIAYNSRAYDMFLFPGFSYAEFTAVLARIDASTTGSIPIGDPPDESRTGQRTIDKFFRPLLKP